MEKEREYLYQHMNPTDLHIDIAKDVSTFYNNLAQYAHLFSSKLFSSSWFYIPSIISWTPNKLLLDQNRPVRNWRGTCLAFPAHGNEQCMLTLVKAFMTAPLLTTCESLNTEEVHHECSDILVFYPSFPHEEAVQGSLFIFTDATIKTLSLKVYALFENRVMPNIFPKTFQMR